MSFETYDINYENLNIRELKDTIREMSRLINELIERNVALEEILRDE